MNNYALLFLFLMPISSSCFQNAPQEEPFWIRQNLQYAYNACQNAPGRRSPLECQQDIAVFISSLPSNSYQALYTLSEENDQAKPATEQVRWFNKKNPQWEGVKRLFNIQITSPETYLPIEKENMNMVIVVGKEPDFYHEGVIDSISVPKKLKNKGYGLALINWGCYKIKQLQPQTNTIFLYASLDGDQDDIAQRIALFLRAGFRPFHRPYIPDVGTIMNMISIDKKTKNAHARAIFMANDPGLIMVKSV
jgi:hypothetical protein